MSSWSAARLALALGLAACSEQERERSREAQDEALRSAGSATVFDATRDAFGQPMPLLSPEHRRSFFVGNSFFNQNWSSAPSSLPDRDGLGPLFNMRSCSGCHFKDGRAQPSAAGTPQRSLVMRISVAGTADDGGPRPEPTYGAQLQPDALPGVMREADVIVHYTEQPGRFPDGTPYALRVPNYAFEQLGYAPLAAELLFSPRISPALSGAGLLEAVEESDVLAHADPEDANHDGVSGRPNRVWDVQQRRAVLGRFGWKAEQPSLRQQVARAFVDDIGITSSLFAADSCSDAQTECRERAREASDGSPEIADTTLDSVVRYVQTLAVPARREPNDPKVRRGAVLFARAGCEACHVATFQTRAITDLPELGRMTIHPYTDLLLHDLGEALSDQRPTFAAAGREWRTPPLWSLGLISKVNGHNCLLHDGRARGVLEAVLWHGGEAASAQAAFVRMTAAERRDLITFVESL
jgi:CxxC motif-containing protein (DUF1111 family)